MDNKLIIECVENGKELNEVFEYNSTGYTILLLFWEYLERKGLAKPVEFQADKQQELLNEFKDLIINNKINHA